MIDVVAVRAEVRVAVGVGGDGVSDMLGVADGVVEIVYDGERENVEDRDAVSEMLFEDV